LSEIVFDAFAESAHAGNRNRYKQNYLEQHATAIETRSEENCTVVHDHAYTQ